MDAMEANPEWDEYRIAAATCRRSIESLLLSNRPVWNKIRIHFSDSPKLLAIMAGAEGIPTEAPHEDGDPHVVRAQADVVELAFLHLTDLHLGCVDEGLWPDFQFNFLDDVQKQLHKRRTQIDAVFFTGDLVMAGKPAQYSLFTQFLNDLWKIPELENAKLLVIPGNHDLSRPKVATDPSVLMLATWDANTEAQKAFWKSPTYAARKKVTSSFKNYTTWLSDCPYIPGGILQGILPGDMSFTLVKKWLRVGIVGLNSTFSQIVGGNYEGKLVLGRNQLHSVCNQKPSEWASTHQFRILLTHQPESWLTPQCKRDFRENIAPSGRFHVHLCGHLHKPITHSETSGGGPVRRLWQGRSLFGLERVENADRLERLHGYSIGKFQFSLRQNSVDCVMWPRMLSEPRQDGSRGMIPDNTYTLEDEAVTELFQMEQFNTIAGIVRDQKN